MVPGIIRYRTYLKIRIDKWNLVKVHQNIQIGTSYSREGGKGYFFPCDQSSNPVGTRSNGMPVFFLENRAAYFSKITLGSKVQQLEEY